MRSELGAAFWHPRVTAHGLRCGVGQCTCM